MSRELRRLGIVLWLACALFGLRVADGAHAAQTRRAVRIQGERILDYNSDIEVRADASMVVTETIRVVSEQNQMRHGIYRDFPTRYTDGWGNRYVVGFELMSATRDGEPESARVEDMSNGKRIYLGRSNVLLEPGTHTYTITYTTNRQLGFFKDHDELFWNVTGNGWGFSIEHATAEVHLPPTIPANEVQLSGYTGPQGSMAKDLTWSTNADGSFQFESERVLPPNSGLSILLTFPTGYFARPTISDRIRYFAQDNRETIIVAAGLAAILLYYMAAWAYAGRDPKPGAIMVQYEPPAGFSPAAIRYLVRMRYDNKTFAACIIDMAVRGYITIKQQAGTYTLYRTKADTRVLSPDEKVVADKLFGDGRTEIWLHNENHVTISAAIAAMRRWLKTAEQKTYFVTNSSYVIPAILLSTLMVIALVATHGGPQIAIAGFACVWLTMWSFGVAALLVTVAHLWKSVFEEESHKAALMGQAIITSLFSIPFVGGEFLGFFFLAKAVSVIFGLVLISTIAVHVLFHYLLKAPTRAGRAVLDKVDGFKMFLGEVESDRINRFEPVEVTPQTFEKLLPYALALDLEHAWASKFSAVLVGASHAPSADAGYSPSWYSGSDWNSLGAAGFASSLGGSFSSAISSSASAPGASGGGGGGSGGGGGGGGGGGW